MFSVLKSKEKAGSRRKTNETEEGTGRFQKNVRSMLYLLPHFVLTMQ